MTLPVPVLDDRTYEQLRDELLRRIPVYAPEWTDLGPSDPGITLLELFAFLGENLLYRFNQIPDATKLWLLRWLQVPPYPARPARGLVTFAPRSPTSPSAVVVEKRTTVRAGKVGFETKQDAAVLPLSATAAVKAVGGAPTDPDLVAAVQRTFDALGGLPEGSEPAYYDSTQLAPDPLAPDFQPLDVSTAVDHCLWVAVQTTADATEMLKPSGPLGEHEISLGFGLDADFPTIDDVDPCDGLDTRPERARLEEAEERARRAACALIPDLPPEEGEQDGDEDDEGGGRSRRPSPLHWQVSTTLRDDDGNPEYLDVDVVADTTRGLTREGVVRLRLPAGLPAVGVVALGDPDQAGTGSLPPPLADEPEVLFWLRAFPREGVPEIGRLTWVGVNAADVEQVVTAPPEFLGVGTGQPDQRVALAHDSVVAESVKVEVERGGVWEPWERVDTFAASRSGDHHYVVEAATGDVRFGDTVRGAGPPVGCRLRVRPYRYGGGREGDVAPGAITKVEAPVDVTVLNPLATFGGEDAEPVDVALGRISGEFARHDRAVTAGDFRELAGALPGVGRAETLARFHPPTRMWEAAGVVTVVVWPREDPRHPDAPVPDKGLIGAVCEHLDARRLVTTELYVVPPTYRKVAVSVGLAVKPDYSPAGVQRWVELVLRQYLAPLPPYGPEGRGWPLGHRVYGPELEAAALQVEGVDFLEGLEVAGLADDGQTWVPGPVELEGWEVVEVADITVVTGPPPPAGEGVEPPPPPATPVPIPVPKDVC